MEIKANELRIGNKTFFNGKQAIGEVTGIKPTGFEEPNIYINNRLDITYLLSDLQPIPLTEEILLKCGFVNYVSRDYTLSNKFFYCSFRFYKNGRVDTFFSGEVEYKKTKDTMFIKYLHQLQNLYFALTNQELEIKL